MLIMKQFESFLKQSDLNPIFWTGETFLVWSRPNIGP